MNNLESGEKTFPLELFGVALFAAFPVLIFAILNPYCLRIWAWHAAIHEVHFPVFARILESVPWIGVAFTAVLWLALALLLLTKIKRHAAFIVTIGTFAVILLFIGGILHSHYFSLYMPDEVRQKRDLIMADLCGFDLDFSTNKNDLRDATFRLVINPGPRAADILKKHKKKIFGEILDEKENSGLIQDVKERIKDVTPR